ncbi:MAG: A/G-specific adenine glycosylase [Pseudomonadota bacterium]
MRDFQMSSRLLDWYDDHARDLPWRVSPERRATGVSPDPYAVWLSEIMLQQTTVASVKSYFDRFLYLWPTVHDLARADDAQVMGEWAGLGYYARARNLLKCAREVVERHQGIFPATEKELQTLPGIGPYTAAAIAAIAYDIPSVVVDGNVERVITRLRDIRTPLPAAKPMIKEAAERLTPQERPGDYAQALMDLGATICSPKSPACGICPWMDPCEARRGGVQSELPAKLPKKPKPTRYGFAYVAQRVDGAWLLERRPDKGLLGGMLGWPCSDWNDAPTPQYPLDADWTQLDAQARHTFTHFHLVLTVFIAHVPLATSPRTGDFLSQKEFRPGQLPTLMRKVFDLAHSEMHSLSNHSLSAGGPSAA